MTKKASNSTDSRQTPALVDDPSVRDVYINRLVGASFDGTALSLTLGVARLSPGLTNAGKQQHQIQIVNRLALSPGAAAELANALAKILTNLGKVAAARESEQAFNEQKAASAEEETS